MLAGATRPTTTRGTFVPKLECNIVINTKYFHEYPIAAITATAAVDAVIQTAIDGPATAFRLVNAGTLDAAAKSRSYRELLCGPGVNLPDGSPLASVLRRTAPRCLPVEQIRGPWLFEEIISRGRVMHLKHFLLGTRDETLATLQREIEARFAGADIVGTLAPPFGPWPEDERDAANQKIAHSGADIVWVALGTPKQDAEALRITVATRKTTVAVGAAFDFTAGTKRQAPSLLQRLHMEWLYRLYSEPGRLWRRYLIGNSRFIKSATMHLLKDLFRGKA